MKLDKIREKFEKHQDFKMRKLNFLSTFQIKLGQIFLFNKGISFILNG